MSYRTEQAAPYKQAVKEYLELETKGLAPEVRGLLRLRNAAMRGRVDLIVCSCNQHRVKAEESMFEYKQALAKAYGQSQDPEGQLVAKLLDMEIKISNLRLFPDQTEEQGPVEKRVAAYAAPSRDDRTPIK